MSDNHIIGIVAGVGPYAGLDLQGKIVAQTVATTDQEHLPVFSISWPGRIPDRTRFLLGRTAENPAYPILEQLELLAHIGATVAGIPCHTVHAPAIFSVIEEGVRSFARPLKLLNMVAEVADHLQTAMPGCRTIGLLATTGTVQARVYQQALEPRDFRVLVPDPAVQETAVHPAIYHPKHGIKASGATSWARESVLAGAADLQQQGAQVIILGCTELPLVLTEPAINDIPLIDSTLILARALIRAAAGRLKE
jgi:aspartate racemase